MQGFLDQYGPQMGLIGLCASLLLLGLVVWLALRLRALSRRWSDLMQGTSGSNVESLLRDHLDRASAISERLERAEKSVDVLETKMQAAKRFLGVVRYDAFDDVGGSQSFALAVYDEKGDGVVVTSMVGRTDCRVYAKEIKAGNAERELSSEEQAAIEAAVRTREAPAKAKVAR